MTTLNCDTWSLRGAAVALWNATVRGSIPGRNGIKTELQVLRNGQ